MDGTVVRSRYAGLSRAFASLLAVLASFLIVYALCRRFDARAAPAILAGILAMILSRRNDRVGFRRVVTVIFLSIWLRNFDERAKSIGALLPLPLVAFRGERKPPVARSSTSRSSSPQASCRSRA